MKRDNAYYRTRLIAEYPAFYRDFRDGVYRSLNEALVAAGLRPRKSAVNEGKQAWRRMTSKEQLEFVEWLKSHATGRAKAKVLPPAVDSSMKLTPAAATAVRKVMLNRSLKMGEVMRELGLNPLDASLAQAVINNYRVRDEVAKALPTWIEANTLGRKTTLAT